MIHFICLSILLAVVHNSTNWIFGAAADSTQLQLATVHGKSTVEKTFFIVAAENFYGRIAEQLAGASAHVVSILNNPHQDPHEFQADAATAKLVAEADIVIYNGLGYDNWMERLLAVPGKPSRIIIKVADLLHIKPGSNPHIWYNPESISALAKKLSQVLDKPAETVVAFQKSMQPLFDKVTALKNKTSGMQVTATEPLFGYMARALDFEMLNEDYQFAVMNGTDPSFQQIVDFEKSLNEKKAKILFYNKQVKDPLASRMLSIAKKSGIPIIGITETLPCGEEGANYIHWMLSELSRVEKVLER